MNTGYYTSIKKKVLLCFIALPVFHVYARTPLISTDSLMQLFNEQVSIFPQEKAYIHTDKPYYMAGEPVWFRVHLAEARTHQPALASRYVYVELINPLDSCVTRVKIRQNENVFNGEISLPEDLPEGNYFLRAYTHFMQNTGTDYLELKNIYVGSPQSTQLTIQPVFEFESDKKIQGTFQFLDPENQQAITPEEVKVQGIDGNQTILKNVIAGTAKYHFDSPAKKEKRVLLLETLYNGYLYRKYLQVPDSNRNFAISFFPEGGDLLEDVPGMVAFKAMYPNGLPADITGEIQDESGRQMVEFQTTHEGMGIFRMHPAKGKKYYAVCKSESGKLLKAELPVAKATGYALKVQGTKEQLIVQLQATPGNPQTDTLYIVAHTRGIVQFTGKWNWDSSALSIPKANMTPGVLQVLLLDANLQPLSERLVFIEDNSSVSEAQVAYHTDKEAYKSRELIQHTVILKDQEGNPLKGNFSVAVTDDHYVCPDSTGNLQTTLLLTSDLRGYIHNPAFYFKKNKLASYALDLLMMTQGWRRYDVTKVIKKEFQKPLFFLEAAPEISGQVKSVLLNKPVQNMEVTIMDLNGDYFNSVQTDAEGHFYFHTYEFPDSTRFLVNSVLKKGLKQVELSLKNNDFPGITGIPSATDRIDSQFFLHYLKRADEKYLNENGMRMIYLDEVRVQAIRKPAKKSVYYSQPDKTLTEEQIEKLGSSDLKTLLLHAGAFMSGDGIILRPGYGTPMLIVNDIPSDINEIEQISASDVAQIDLLKNAANTAIFNYMKSTTGSAANGVIAVYTKRGKINYAPKPYHIKMVAPLGYQKPAEFYAPRYDTPQTRNNPTPDLRTTIHWQASVQSNESGEAVFSYYSADGASSYSVIIEGITDTGKIIQQTGRINVD